MSKDPLIPLQEELLRRLGYDYVPDFIDHYQEIIDLMLEHCPIRFAYEVCRISETQYERHRKYLLSTYPYNELQKLIISEDEIELAESDLSVPAESELLEALLYCWEDSSEENKEDFEFLLKRTNELSVDIQVFGQLISEINQAQEPSSFWHSIRMELLFRKVNEKDRSKGEVRIARGVVGPNHENDFSYFGTLEEAEEFETYRRKLAESSAFALAEWIDIYRPFIDFKS